MKHPIYLFFILFLAFLTLGSCNSQKETTTTVANPEDSLPGRKVMIMYPDSTPNIVHFYKVDSSGNLTNELLREIRYYKNKKKYTDCSFVTVKEDSAYHAVKDGPAFAYHKNGKIQTEAFYVKGKEQGEYKVYREDGTPLYEGYYNMGERDGEWKFYFKHGQVAKWGFYKNGICSGKWIDYEIDGEIIRTIDANDTTIVCNDCPKCINLLKRKK